MQAGGAPTSSGGGPTPAPVAGVLRGFGGGSTAFGEKTRTCCWRELGVDSVALEVVHSRRSLQPPPGSGAGRALGGGGSGFGGSTAGGGSGGGMGFGSTTNSGDSSLGPTGRQHGQQDLANANWMGLQLLAFSEQAERHWTLMSAATVSATSGVRRPDSDRIKEGSQAKRLYVMIGLIGTGLSVPG